MSVASLLSAVEVAHNAAQREAVVLELSRVGRVRARAPAARRRCPRWGCSSARRAAGFAVRVSLAATSSVPVPSPSPFICRSKPRALRTDWNRSRCTNLSHALGCTRGRRCPDGGQVEQEVDRRDALADHRGEQRDDEQPAQVSESANCKSDEDTYGDVPCFPA